MFKPYPKGKVKVANKLNTGISNREVRIGTPEDQLRPGFKLFKYMYFLLYVL